LRAQQIQRAHIDFLPHSDEYQVAVTSFKVPLTVFLHFFTICVASESEKTPYVNDFLLGWSQTKERYVTNHFSMLLHNFLRLWIVGCGWGTGNAMGRVEKSSVGIVFGFSVQVSSNFSD
jgi:hypothetical protein